jgi:hypothetical protein
VIDDVEPWWRTMRHGTFRFYWMPGVRIGVYRIFYDGWILTFNFGLFSLEWYH